MSHNGQPPVKIEGEGSEILVREALAFARNSATNPFFIVIWFGSPHSPYYCSEQDSAPYRGLGNELSWRYGEITAMDRAIGRFRDGLADMELRDNTLLWFKSDNGMTTEGIPKEQQARQFNAGLRGSKAHMYEGGLRVPGIIEWPAVIDQPRRSAVPCVTSDILPTLLDILNLRHPQPDRPLDGISLKPLIVEGTMTQRPTPIGFSGYDWRSEQKNPRWLRDNNLNAFITRTAPRRGATKRDRQSFFKNHRHPVAKTEFSQSRAWIDNRYKLVFPKGRNPKYELYDLEEDSEESVDLAAHRPEMVDRMARQMNAWLLSVENSLTGADYRTKN